MTEHTPPKAIIVYGESLGSTQEQYMALLQQIGKMGLRVSVLPPNIHQDSFQEVPTAEESKRYFESLTTVSYDMVTVYAEEHGFHRPRATAGWSKLKYSGIFFPTVPEAIGPSVEAQSVVRYGREGSKPVFYYPGELLTPKLIAAGHSKGYDFLRGLNWWQIQHGATWSDYYGSPYRYEDLWNISENIIRQSSIESESLVNYVYSEAFAAIDGIGKKTLGLYRGYCADQFPSQLPKTEEELVAMRRNWEKFEETDDLEGWLQSLLGGDGTEEG